MQLCSTARRSRCAMRETGIDNSIRELTRKPKTDRQRRHGAAWGCVVRTSVFLIACVCGAHAADQNFVLVGAGSSVPLPLFNKWADVYNQSNANVQLRYMAMGNSEGINQ